MKTTDIVIDSLKTIGKPPYIACSCEPVYDYDDNNHRTDKITCYKVEIALPEMKLAKVGIKVATTKNPLPEVAEDLQDVDFTNLTLGIYIDRANRIQLYGKADNVHIVDSKEEMKNSPKG